MKLLAEADGKEYIPLLPSLNWHLFNWLSTGFSEIDIPFMFLAFL
jgi:hypothetical protein